MEQTENILNWLHVTENDDRLLYLNAFSICRRKTHLRMAEYACETYLVECPEENLNEES